MRGRSWSEKRSDYAAVGVLLFLLLLVFEMELTINTRDAELLATDES